MQSYHTVNQLVRVLEYREQVGQTTDVVAEGPRGAGKSNGTHWINELLEPDFDFETVYVYDGVDLLKHLRLNKGEKGVRTWFDEAKNLIYRRNAMTRLNKSISTMMSQIRERRGTRFWVSPDIGELENFLTQDQAQVLLTFPYNGTMIARRFWKSYHAAPGQREGRWVKMFQHDNVPWMGDSCPEREAVYRKFKSEGYGRVEQGLVDKLLAAAQKRTKTTMGIDRQEVSKRHSIASHSE